MTDNKLNQLDVLLINPPFHTLLKEHNTHFPLGLGYLVSVLKQSNIKALIYNADYYQNPDLKSNVFFEYIENKIRKIFGKKIFYIVQNIKIHLKKIIGKVKNKLNKLINKQSLTGYRNRSELQSYVMDDKDTIWRDMKFVIKKSNPRVIGLSSKMVDLPSVFKIAKIAKDINPKIKVVIGGSASSTFGESIIPNENIDYLVVGEGEITFPELVKSLLNLDKSSDWREIDGIVFKENNEIIKTKTRTLIKNIDEIPFPDRDSMFILEGNKHIKFIVEKKDIFTSRGCPYSCKFCSCHSVWNTKKPRIRSNNNIIEELKYLYNELGQKEFLFWDDLFTINRDKTIDLCNKFKENQLNITWTCLVRLNTIDSELLSIMKEAGCVEVAVGIESGNDRVLKHIGKSLSVDTILEKTKLLDESGLRWLAFYIIGFPTETKEEIKDTINLVKKLNPTHSRVGPFTPFPGSKFWTEVSLNKDTNHLLTKEDLFYMYYNFTGTMDNECFEELLNEAIVLNT